MKLSRVNFPKIQNKNISFSGYSNKKDQYGEKTIEFFAPPYDKNKYQIALEIVPASKGETSDKYSVQSATSPIVLKQGNDGKFNLREKRLEALSTQGEHIGYRFSLTDAEGKKTYITEPGLKDFRGDFNIIPKNVSAPQKHGTMYHMFVDSYYNPEWAVKKPNATRNHFNLLGGNIAGMIEKIKDGKLDSYGLLMTTPLFGKDEISSHGYWTANPYQIAGTKGTLEDFKNLNFELFKKGKQYVADGAFTSQGYQSPQLQNVLAWGNESPYFNWFNLDETKENLSDTVKINLPALPENDKALENVTYKIVEKDGRVHLQIFDRRFVSEKDAKSNELIKKYDLEKHSQTKDINTHKDSVNLYHFDITNESKEKIRELKENAGKNIENGSIKLTHFNITQPKEASGASFWDGNLDLIKMNLAEGTLGSEQARHYLFRVATYWTKTIANTLAMKTIENGASEAEIIEIAKNNKLSIEKLNSIKENIQSGDYTFNGLSRFENDNDFLLNEILEYPLESINLPDDITAILADGSITPNLKSIDDKDKSNIELMGNTEVKNFYNEIILNAVKNTLNSINSTRGDIFEGGKLTDFGKLIAQNLIPEIIEYTVVNKLGGIDCVEVLDGKIKYNKDTISKMNLGGKIQQGYSYESVKNQVVGMLNSSTGNPNSEAIRAIADKYKNVDANTLKLITAIVEQTGAGLNWRFDASKDVSSFELTKKAYEEGLGKRNFEATMDSTISFWEEFTRRIKEQNPNSYIIAEVTDLGKYYNWDFGGESAEGNRVNKRDFGKYINSSNAEKVFFEKTGITTGSNYSQYFGLYPQLFGSNIETGETVGVDGKKDEITLNSIKKANDSFIDSMPLPFVTNNHVFTDNHDKPRTIHGFALDMNAFLNGNFETKISRKGSGMAKFYRETIDKIDKKTLSVEVKNKLKNAVGLMELGKTSADAPENKDRARAFGVRPIEITVYEILDMAEITDKAERERIAKAILETGLKTPMDKYKTLWQIMVGNTGIPTIFGGSEYGQTGHETPSKNQELGCRNITMHEREASKDMFEDFYKQINATSNLANEKGLSAISGGVPVNFDAIPSGCGAQNVTGVYKYDEHGSEVINVLYLGDSVVKSEYGNTLGTAKFNPKKNAMADFIWVKSGTTQGIKNNIFVEGAKYKRKEYNPELGKYVDSEDEFIIKGDKLIKVDGGEIRIDIGNNIFYKV